MLKEPKRILITDDEDEVRFFLRSMLEDAGYETEEAGSGEEALKMAENTSFDVILLDVMLPQINGHEVCKRLRNITANALYIIMLSAKDKALDKVEGFRSGADDYVAKPFDRQELLARVERGWQTVENLRLAKIDFLTGLVNRRGCIEILTREMAQALRSQSSLCLAILDLDFFKLINDTYGHVIGDNVLIELAKLMQKHLRTSDYIPARLGGDEFALVFPSSDLPDSVAVLERLCGIVSNHLFPEVGAGTLTCSIGLTILNKQDHLKTFLDRADKALYCAKEKGRNQVSILQ